MKVFKMNDCDWVCAEDDKSAVEFYEEETGERVSLLDFKECDIEKDGMWFGFWNIEELRDFLKQNKDKKFTMKYDRTGENDFVVQLTFKQVIEINKIEKPEIICSTEY